MERSDEQSAVPLWLPFVILFAAFALGWVLNKSGLGQVVSQVTLVAFLPLLAVCALFVFALPFLKHLPPLPRLPLPGWLTRWGFPMLGLTFGFSTIISSHGSSALYFLAVAVICLIAAEVFRARKRDG